MFSNTVKHMMTLWRVHPTHAPARWSNAKTFEKRLLAILLLVLALSAGFQSANGRIIYETERLSGGDVPIQVHILKSDAWKGPYAAILMVGSLKESDPPFWSTNLLREGFMLVAFTAEHAPDPDPARRPQWLNFDERFAHSYVEGGIRAARDSRVVIDFLVAKKRVLREKIGWMGSSSSGIPGLAVATQGPRLAAVVAFVSTGAYEEWLQSWHTHGLWRGKGPDLWPETRELLKYDPIRHATNLFPTAVLMVSGGDDKIVDPRTAASFMKAARPAYQADPNRLRLVIYDGFGHNLPADLVQMHAEHWFRLYMHPKNPPPTPEGKPASLSESVKKTQINSADHKDLIKAK